MAEDVDLVEVTSQAWVDRFAKGLLEVKASEAPYYHEIRDGDRTIRIRPLVHFDDSRTAAQKFVDKGQAVPPSIVRALLEELKPKKGGRHARPEQWAAERANAISCYLAMERLLKVEPGLSQTAAGERVGKLRGRSCAAVVRAWKHLKQAP